jgi:tetratricopeptide (TPR) repeat protein
VNEPYLDATIRPQILFPAYVSGFTLAESFYLAMPYLSWQTIVVGDPLCAPFAGTPLAPGDLDKGLDSEIGLPALFVERRLAIAAKQGLSPAAVKLLLRLESEAARGERSNIETLLVRATDLEPRLIAAQMQLAMLYASRQDYDKSIDRYRRVLAVDAENTVAMNNLAYYLAEHGHAPEEALTIAQRAFRLAPEPAYADTVGWIHHLLGNDNAAVPFIDLAVVGLPRDPDVLIHAATIHAAVGQTDRARRELDAAEKLSLSERQRGALNALRERLERP